MKSRTKSVWCAVVGAAAAAASSGCTHIIRQEGVNPRAACGIDPASHNQTPEKAILIIDKDPHVLGTGVFLVPAPEHGAEVHTVRFVRDLKYGECVRRGEMVAAYKFIPNELETYDKLIAAASLCPTCGNGRVVGCPNACLCYGYVCIGNTLY